MKVNILGRGIIPGVGTIPPQYGLDLPEHKISNILKYASFKVYVTSTGVPVTKKNLVQLIALEAQKNAPTPLTLKVEPSAPVKKEEAKVETVVETPVAEEVKEETPVVEETVKEEIKEEAAVEETPVVEETVTEEEAPVVEEVKTTSNSKKKKK